MNVMIHTITGKITSLSVQELTLIESALGTVIDMGDDNLHDMGPSDPTYNESWAELITLESAHVKIQNVLKEAGQ